jgi:hypothetical protein
MTSAELKTISDSMQNSVKQADFDKVMALMEAAANLGEYKLEYRDTLLKSTINKLEGSPNLFTVKDLTANEGFYIIKW